MIYEPKNPDYNAIAAKQKKYDNPRYGHFCGHSKYFWETAKKAEFGDQILCETCNRYFAKIKNMAWVIPEKEIKPFPGPYPKNIKFSFMGHSNHLGHGANATRISEYYLTHVECRVTS